MPGNPVIVILFSGKRKCGKDYIANLLVKKFDDAVIIHLSGPLKERYALEHGLDYNLLLGCSNYKEQFREKMIKWGEEIRDKEPGYFCRHALQQSNAHDKKIWIVSDARRKTDIEYFKTHYPKVTFTLRIEALQEIRIQRGWIFTEGVDDVESECDLDSYTSWDFKLRNNDAYEVAEDIDCLVSIIKMRIQVSTLSGFEEELNSNETLCVK